MDKASNFTEVKILSCYHDLENGHGHAYLHDIPSHLKQEWKELHRSHKKVVTEGETWKTKPVKF